MATAVTGPLMHLLPQPEFRDLSPGANYSWPDTGSAWGRQSPCSSTQYRVPVNMPQNQIAPWWILTFPFFVWSTRLWIRKHTVDKGGSAQFCLYKHQPGLGTGDQASEQSSGHWTVGTFFVVLFLCNPMQGYSLWAVYLNFQQNIRSRSYGKTICFGV